MPESTQHSGRRREDSSSLWWDSIFSSPFSLLFSSILPAASSIPLVIVTVAEAADTPTFEVRLANGVSLLDGIVQVRPNTDPRWGTICSNIFKNNRNGANVVCSQLGYEGTTESYAVSFGPSPDRTTPIWLDQLDCSAEYQRLVLVGERHDVSNCVTTVPVGKTVCFHGDDAGVRCVPRREGWEFKLVNSSRASRGLVMMRPHTSLPWGTVNAAYFRKSKAARAFMCKKLGYASVKDPYVPEGAEADAFGTARTASSPTSTADGGAPCYWNITGCPSDDPAAGTEITKCSSGYLQEASWGTADQLKLVCDDELLNRVDILSVRLVGGTSNTNGQIQIELHPGGTFRYVPASALLSGPYYGATDALSTAPNALIGICLAAGVSGVMSYSTPPGFRYFGKEPVGNGGTPSTKGEWGTIICATAGTTLSQCKFNRPQPLPDESILDWQTTMAKGSGDYPAGVDCNPSELPSTSDWLVRLQPGSSTSGSYGILQHRVSTTARWGYVANERHNDFGLWAAFCAALGYSVGAGYSVVALRNLTNYVGSSAWETDPRAITPIYVSNVSCPYNSRRQPGSSSPGIEVTNPRTGCSYAPILSHLTNSSRLLALDCSASTLGTAATNPVNWYTYLIGGYGNGGRGTLSLHPSRYDDEDDLDPTVIGVICTTDPNALLFLCRRSGYSTVNVVEETDDVTPVEDNGIFYLYNLTCDFNASSWSQCRYDAFRAESCAGSRPARVWCSASSDRSQWEIALNTTGATRPGQGKLMMRPSPDEPWGTICDDSWTLASTYAACRSLGYSNPVGSLMLAYNSLGPGSGPIYLDDVQCIRSEMYLQNCSRMLFKQHNCGHLEDVGVQCVEGAEQSNDLSTATFRKVQVATNIFRIEVNFGGGWGTIRQTSYRTVDVARAACGSVGISNSQVFDWYSATAYASTTLRPIAFNIRCPSTATALSECTPDTSNMVYYETDDAYSMVVKCLDTLVNHPTVSWTFQLHNGSRPSMGKIMMKPNASVGWGSVCDDSWNAAASMAFCKSFGYPNPQARLHSLSGWGLVSTMTPSIYGFGAELPATVPIWLDDVNCFGYALEELYQCSYNLNHNCHHSEDVAVDCDPIIVDTRQMLYRLVPTDPRVSVYRGRLELRPTTSFPWGTITDYARTDANMAEAACRTLGLFRSADRCNLEIVTNAGNDVPSYTDAWWCPPNPTGMAQCRCTTDTFYNISRMYHDYDLGVDCRFAPSTSPSQWSFRLAAAAGSNPPVGVGRLEMRPATSLSWGTVCGRVAMPAVLIQNLCTAAGFPPAGTDGVKRAPSVVSASAYGDASAMPVWLEWFTCESPIRNCSSNTYQYPAGTTACEEHQHDVALDCAPTIYPIASFQYQLVPFNADIPTEGRVEMRPSTSEAWGSIAVAKPTLAIVQAACVSLGYTAARAGFSQNPFPGTGKVWTSNYTCTAGNSGNGLGGCTFDRNSFDTLTRHDDDLVVDCNNFNATSPSGLQYRLVTPSGDITEKKGRLEVRPSSTADWGSVTSAGFKPHHAAAACRAAGVAVPDPADAYFTTMPSDQRVGYVWLSLKGCEAEPATIDDIVPKVSTLTACTSVTWRPFGASHADDVWVDCFPTIQFRLTGGPQASEGRVEVKLGAYATDWGTLCNDRFDRNLDAQRMVCLKAGFSADVKGRVRDGYGYYGSSSSAIVLDDLTCSAGAAELTRCRYAQVGTSNCAHSEDVFLSCRPSTETLTMTLSRVPVATRTMIIARTLTFVESVTGFPTRTGVETGEFTLTKAITATVTRTHCTRSSSMSSSHTSTVTLSVSRTVTLTASATASPPTPTASESPSATITNASTITTSAEISISPSFSSSLDVTRLSFVETMSKEITVSNGSSTASVTEEITPNTTSLELTESMTLTETHTVSLRSPTSTTSMELPNTTTMEISASTHMTSSRTIPIPEPPVLFQAVPEAVTAAMTSVAVAVGGASAAVDAQALAIIGLVDCGKADDGSAEAMKGYRSISPVALSDSCEGVLMGNGLVLSAVMILSFLGSVIVRFVKRTPSFKTAMAIVRAPSTIFTFATLFLNSFAVCGTSLLRSEGLFHGDGTATLYHEIDARIELDHQLGMLSWCAVGVILLSFPTLALLYGSRRLHVLKYEWEHHSKWVMRFALWCLPGSQLDARYPAVQSLASLIGAYRRLGCGWTMVSLLSFFGTLPTVLAYKETCAPLFTLSGALFLIFAAGVGITLPRRTFSGDVIHVVVLTANGCIMFVSAGLIKSPGTVALEVIISVLGYVLTFCTFVRICLTVIATSIRFLTKKGKITGVVVLPRHVDDDSGDDDNREEDDKDDSTADEDEDNDFDLDLAEYYEGAHDEDEEDVEMVNANTIPDVDLAIYNVDLAENGDDPPSADPDGRKGSNKKKGFSSAPPRQKQKNGKLRRTTAVDDQSIGMLEIPVLLPDEDGDHNNYISSNGTTRNKRASDDDFEEVEMMAEAACHQSRRGSGDAVEGENAYSHAYSTSAAGGDGARRLPDRNRLSRPKSVKKEKKKRKKDDTDTDEVPAASRHVPPAEPAPTTLLGHLRNIHWAPNRRPLRGDLRYRSLLWPLQEDKHAAVALVPFLSFDLSALPVQIVDEIPAPIPSADPRPTKRAPPPPPTKEEEESDDATMGSYRLSSRNDGAAGHHHTNHNNYTIDSAADMLDKLALAEINNRSLGLRRHGIGGLDADDEDAGFELDLITGRGEDDDDLPIGAKLVGGDGGGNGSPTSLKGFKSVYSDIRALLEQIALEQQDRIIRGMMKKRKKAGDGDDEGGIDPPIGPAA